MPATVTLRLIPVIINVLALLFFLQQYRRAKDEAGRRFITSTAIVFLLITFVCYNSYLESQHISMPWWQYSLGNAAMHIAMIVAYFLDDQFLNNQVHSLKNIGRHKVFWIPLISTIMMVTADYLRSENFISITDPASFERSVLYTISHLSFHGALVYGGTHTILLFYRSIGRYTDAAFIGRCIIFMIGIGLGAFFASLAMMNLLAALMIEHRYQVAINTFIQNIGRATVFPTFVLGFILPKRIYVRIGQPIERYKSWRQKQDQELLAYVHAKMIQIAPTVHLQNEQLRHVRLLIEIGDARELILSRVPTSRQLLSARQEAMILFDLLHTNHVFDRPGTHVPAEIQSDIVQHSLAVARYLKRFEKWGNYARWMVKQV